MYLSVIIPAYNEEKRITKTLLDAGEYLKNQDYESEVIVVDDGSADNTAGIVSGLKNKIKNLSLVSNGLNRGKGFSVRRGMISASGEYRLFMDADNSTPISEISKLLPFLSSGYDIAIGSRSVEGSNIISAQPWQRKFLGNCYALMVKIFAGLYGFRDTQCGFKVFSAESANDIFSKCRINGWSFDVETLALAKKLGYTVKEVPINWQDSPGTKVKIKGIIKAGFDLLRIRWYAIGVKQEKAD